MVQKENRKKISGTILGLALGDAMGGPFEFGPVQRARDVMGKDWIDGLYPYDRCNGAHAAWGNPPPAGTGTDDTRYNWIFLNLAIKLGHFPSAEEWSEAIIHIYENPENYFPRHADLAGKQFKSWEGVCRGYLNESSFLHPGISPEILRTRSIGVNFPSLIGLISLTTAGLFFPGNPEKAYISAYQTDFVDIGYAREAVGILAAGISLAAAGNNKPKDIIESIIHLDPLSLKGDFGGPFTGEHLSTFLSHLPKGKSDREISDYLSGKLIPLHPFDPYKTLAIAFTAILHTGGDSMRSLQIAVNHSTGSGQSVPPAKYQDIDCYGSVTGAMVGALNGIDSFPRELIDRVISSNREIYHIDLPDTIDHFLQTFPQNPF